MDEPRNTAQIRAKMLKLWKMVDAKQVTAHEVRLHIGIARVILETMKVEIAMAHLNRSNVPSISISPVMDAPPKRPPPKRIQ